MSQPIPTDYLSVDCWTMLSRPSAAGMRTGQPAGVRVRALVQRHCKTKSGWCRNATSQKINYTIHRVLVFLLLEKSCRPCWKLKHWFIPILVKITITQCFLSELMTTKALCYTKYHIISLYNDTGFQRACLLGAGWILGGKLESGEEVLQRLFAVKGGG